MKLIYSRLVSFGACRSEGKCIRGRLTDIRQRKFTFENQKFWNNSLAVGFLHWIDRLKVKLVLTFILNQFFPSPSSVEDEQSSMVSF